VRVAKQQWRHEVDRRSQLQMQLNYIQIAFSRNRHGSRPHPVYNESSAIIALLRSLVSCLDSGGSVRAIHIIVNFSRGMLYMSMLSTANLITLASRRADISRKFFTQITEPTSCLHQLLPDPREHSIISGLRSYEKFPRVFTRTKQYCSFIHYALNHYQDSITN